MLVLVVFDLTIAAMILKLHVTEAYNLMQLILLIKVEINKPTGCILIFYTYVQVSSPYKLTGNFIASKPV